MWPVVASVTTAALLAVLAGRYLTNRYAGAACVMLFATMPMVWHGVRQASAHLALLPFLPAWLLACHQFTRSGRPVWMALAGGLLALMASVHPSGVLMAPIYASITVVTLLARRDGVAAGLALAGGFAAGAVPLVFEWASDPGAVSQLVNSHGLYDAERLNVLQGVREVTSWTGLTARSEVYWHSFNPALLFLDGVFLLPFAVPFVRGVFACAISPRGAMDVVMLGALLVSPMTVALLAQPPVTSRLLLMAPVAALIAARGCYPGAFKISAATSPATPLTSASTR